MDRILFIGGLITSIGALDMIVAALLIFRSRKASLDAALEREYGPVLELYENGVRSRSLQKGSVLRRK